MEEVPRRRQCSDEKKSSRGTMSRFFVFGQRATLTGAELRDVALAGKELAWCTGVYRERCSSEMA